MQLPIDVISEEALWAFFVAGLLRRRGRLRMGGYVGMDHLTGTAFEDSPLVASEQPYVMGVFFSWKLWESEARAPESVQREVPSR